MIGEVMQSFFARAAFGNILELGAEARAERSVPYRQRQFGRKFRSVAAKREHFERSPGHLRLSAGGDASHPVVVRAAEPFGHDQVD